MSSAEATTTRISLRQSNTPRSNPACEIFINFHSKINSELLVSVSACIKNVISISNNNGFKPCNIMLNGILHNQNVSVKSGITANN